MFNKIVVGVDSSKTSENALGLACDLSQKYSSEIFLIHTPEPKTVAFAMGAIAGYHAVTTMPSAEEVTKAGEKILVSASAIVKKYGQKVAGTNMDLGKPADQIVAYAENCGADLIITGRRGLGNIETLLQGSTSQRVNHLAKCACMSVF